MDGHDSTTVTRKPGSLNCLKVRKTKWTIAVVAAETRGPDLQKETVCIITEGKP